MTHWLFENPTLSWIVGVVLGTLAGLVFLTRRTLAWLLIWVGIVGCALLFVLLEWLVVTPKEEVEQATHALAASVEANDLPGVLALIDPSAERVREDAQKFLAQLNVAKAHVGGRLLIEVDSTANPERATGRFRAMLDAISRKRGMKVVYFDQVELQWIRKQDQWLITAYSAKSRGQAISPSKR